MDQPPEAGAASPPNPVAVTKTLIGTPMYLDFGGLSTDFGFAAALVRVRTFMTTGCISLAESVCFFRYDLTSAAFVPWLATLPARRPGGRRRTGRPSEYAQHQEGIQSRGTEARSQHD